MERIKALLSSWLIVMISVISLPSCDVDIHWWDSIYDSDLYGEWRIQESSYGAYYRQGDNWYFASNGMFATAGYGLNSERGEWERRGDEVRIYLTNSNSPSIIAYIRTLDNDYMVLDVNDYDNGRYTLKLIREYYYAKPKVQSVSSERNQ